MDGDIYRELCLCLFTSVFGTIVFFWFSHLYFIISIINANTYTLKNPSQNRYKYGVSLHTCFIFTNSFFHRFFSLLKTKSCLGTNKCGSFNSFAVHCSVGGFVPTLGQVYSEDFLQAISSIQSHPCQRG